MNNIFNYVSCVSILLSIACGGVDSTSITKTNCEGDLLCSCYPNSTCNESLTCLSNICVDPTTSVGGTFNESGGSQNNTGGISLGGELNTGGTSVTTGGSNTGGSIIIERNWDFDNNSIAQWNDTLGKGTSSSNMPIYQEYVTNEKLCLASNQKAGWPIDSNLNLSFPIVAGKVYEVSFDVIIPGQYDYDLGLVSFGPDQNQTVTGSTVSYTVKKDSPTHIVIDLPASVEDFKLGLFVKVDYLPNGEKTCFDNFNVTEK